MQCDVITPEIQSRVTAVGRIIFPLTYDCDVCMWRENREFTLVENYWKTIECIYWDSFKCTADKKEKENGSERKI